MSIDANLQIAGAKFINTNDLRVKTEGINATYGAVGTRNTPAANATDVVTISGSATKTIKIKKVLVAGNATTASSKTVYLVKRTAANVGGTSTSVTAGKFDSTDGAATAAVALYTANPTTLGAGTPIAYHRCNFNVAGSNGVVEFDFSARNDKPIILNGAAEYLAINFNANTVNSGDTFGYAIEWEEV